VLPLSQSPTPPPPLLYTVAALYRFVDFDNFASYRVLLQSRLETLGIRGSLLLAREGINGTVAGSARAIDALIGELRRDRRFADLDVKLSRCQEMPFKRTRVRLKKEIVTMGISEVDPCQSVGTYVAPEDWNALVDDPEVTLIDTRNEYEISIGSFVGANNPHTDSFRQFPGYARQHLDPAKHTKIAMYCTGGIRCEKSTALLKQQGFDEVYHLRGGILKYLETIPREESRFEGDCFVFDRRVSVGHGLEVGLHHLCFACGWPVTPADQQSDQYVPGVQCPRCVDQTTAEQKRRFAERQRQTREPLTCTQPLPASKSAQW